MRNLLFIIFIILLYGSCSEQTEDFTYEDSVKMGTKSLNPDGFAVNWENETEITLTNNNRVKLPWVRTSTSIIPYEIASDIKKVDGWEFMSVNNDDLGSDYLIFHNKFTGILKIYYYYSGQNLNNNAIWTLRDESKNNYLNQGTYFTYPINKHLQDQVSIGVVSLSNTVGIDKGWNCFQLPITYSGRAGYLDAFVNVLNISSLELDGNYTEKTEGTIIEKHSNNPAADKVNTVAKSVGEKAGSWVSKKATESKEDKKGIFRNLSKFALDEIVSGGTTYLVKSGLNALFGSFIGTFKKDEPKIQNVELTTTGHLKMTGNITTPSSGIANPVNGIEGTNLGAWNLESNPECKVYIEHAKIYTADRKKTKSEYYQFFCGVPTYKVIINPKIKDLVSVQTTASYVEFEGLRWDSIFADHYKGSFINRNPFMDGGKVFRNKDYNYDTHWPSIYQTGPYEKTGYLDNRTFGPMSYLYTYAIRYDHSYLINPYDYSKVVDYNNILYNDSSIDRESDIVFNPQTFNPTTSQIDGKRIMYFGNIGVSITVTLTVKSTGEKIISSRTYIPEYKYKQ